MKPKSEMQKAAQREIEEAMKKVKEAQSLITAAADSGTFPWIPLIWKPLQKLQMCENFRLKITMYIKEIFFLYSRIIID